MYEHNDPTQELSVASSSNRADDSEGCPICGAGIQYIERRGPSEVSVSPCGHDITNVQAYALAAPEQRRVATDGGQNVEDAENGDATVEMDALAADEDEESEFGENSGTLSQELEEIEERQEELRERKEQLTNGEVQPPWPYTSNYAYLIAGASLVAGGGLFAFGNIAEQGGASAAAVVMVVAGIAVGSYGRWFTRHFETGQQPTYGTDEVSE